MIRYTSAKQLSIEDFKTPFEMVLDKNNRWVQLATLIPWDELAAEYHKTLSSNKGAPGIDARIVIGSIIIKHKLKLDDRGVVAALQENIYLQYFVGLSSFTTEELFDRSLLTTFRKRLGHVAFDKMNQSIVHKSMEVEKRSNPITKGKKKDNEDSRAGHGSDPEETKQTSRPKGKLKIDATVADQMIKYPTDLDLVSDSRQESERLIDKLCKKFSITSKPRTYRKNARWDYLNLAKKKNKNKKELRKAIGKQLNYLRRNIKTIHKLLDHYAGSFFPLCHRDQKIFWVIQHIHDQQRTMHESQSHSISDRIVNIYQPHVRPIVRGKAKAHVEFGSKLGVSEHNGYARINTFSWNAYNEGTDLKNQVEDYYSLYGYYPEVVIADTIYGTRENRAWLKERNIRFSGKPLGRPPIEPPTKYQKSKLKKEKGERNHIEGKFGQGKNGYALNKIRARLQITSESWVAAIFFVMNLERLLKDFLFSLFYALLTTYTWFKEMVYASVLFAEPQLTCSYQKIKPCQIPKHIRPAI
jgi:transposase, IS5 family